MFTSGVPLTMLGLNLTHQALATPPIVERLLRSTREIARVVAGWITFFGSTYEELWGFAGPPVHDVCAVALAIDPTLIRLVDAFVAIETRAGGRAARPSSTCTGACAASRTRASRSSSTRSASGTS